MNLKRMSVILMALSASLTALPANSATLRVPQDYSTIQGALRAAMDGDEVVVSPGVYKEKLEFQSVVVLRSTFDGHDWSIVENTVINYQDVNLPAVLNTVHDDKGNAPTIRGFRITRDPVPSSGYYGVGAQGILGDLNVEYNIIENQVNWSGTGVGGQHLGAAISNNHGCVIQNNIIRNNKAEFGAAFYACGLGVIRNNVLYGNISLNTIVESCSSDLINNTFHSNHTGVAIGGCRGKIANNIVWETLTRDNPDGHGIPIADSSTPHNCILQGYKGPGVGNIDADPRFVNPAQGDFRLRPDSPAIDSGVSTQGLAIDLEGNPRGKIWRTQGTMGDGSHTDIGAHEFQPQPLTLWTPAYSEPGYNGRPLVLKWVLASTVTPVSFDLSLVRPGQSSLALGRYAASAGHSTFETAGQWQVTLPSKSLIAPDYQVVARSASGTLIQAQTAPFKIQSFNAINPDSWSQYQ